ncbi:hypothetical protein K9M79_02850 [Candidatus Woesearchaeota archaeon]|nr:hypothetical protein [Candidatus Woesearchaeota archaeon]
MKLIKIYNKITYGVDGFAHCGIITNGGLDEIQIHEAIGKGFVKSWYPKLFIEKMIEEKTCKIQYPKIKLSNVEKNADNYLGKGYGFLDILGIGISFITGWRFIKLTGASKLICSEAVARILYDSSNKKINFEEEYKKPYDLITPMDLYLSEQLKNV